MSLHIRVDSPQVPKCPSEAQAGQDIFKKFAQMELKEDLVGSIGASYIELWEGLAREWWGCCHQINLCLSRDFHNQYSHHNHHYHWHYHKIIIINSMLWEGLASEGVLPPNKSVSLS